jgi:hypothetical protein
VRLVSPIGGAPGGSGNLSISLSNVARLAAHPKFVWVFNANYDATIFYNDPVIQDVYICLKMLLSMIKNCHHIYISHLNSFVFR